MSLNEGAPVEGRAGARLVESLADTRKIGSTGGDHTIDPEAFRGIRRVLFVHAHPDDETLSSGCLIVALVSRGVECDVVTCTRGELGEVVNGPLAHLAGSPDLELRREAELREALDALGVAAHAYLGTPPARAAGLPPRHYRDSGMRWLAAGIAGPADDSDPHSLTAAEPRDAEADLVAWIEVRRPDLVVSYDAHGGYGHPDHVRVHQVSKAAAGACRVRFSELRREPGPGVAWFDLPETLRAVQAALACHATQLSVEGSNVVHVGGQREAIVTACGLSAPWRPST